MDSLIESHFYSQSGNLCIIIGVLRPFVFNKIFHIISLNILFNICLSFLASVLCTLYPFICLLDSLFLLLYFVFTMVFYLYFYLNLVFLYYLKYTFLTYDNLPSNYTIPLYVLFSNLKTVYSCSLYSSLWSVVLINFAAKYAINWIHYYYFCIRQSSFKAIKVKKKIIFMFTLIPCLIIFIFFFVWMYILIWYDTPSVYKFSFIFLKVHFFCQLILSLLMWKKVFHIVFK